jgi:hypothetical protein
VVGTASRPARVSVVSRNLRVHGDVLAVVPVVMHVAVMTSGDSSVEFCMAARPLVQTCDADLSIRGLRQKFVLRLPNLPLEVEVPLPDLIHGGVNHQFQ